MRLHTYVLGLALISTGTMAFAHDPSDRDRDDNQRGGRYGDHDRNNSNSAYDQGYRQGMWDAQHARNSSNPWRNGRNHGQWNAGYNRGLHEERNNRGNGTWNDGTGNDGRNRGNRNGGYGNQAAQIGYQDGRNDGLKDRRTGHSFRPTQGDNYKNATRGYNSSFGAKDSYKQEYRQAYGNGYQRGYNQNGGYGR